MVHEIESFDSRFNENNSMELLVLLEGMDDPIRHIEHRQRSRDPYWGRVHSLQEP